MGWPIRTDAGGGEEVRNGDRAGHQPRKRRVSAAFGWSAATSSAISVRQSRAPWAVDRIFYEAASPLNSATAGARADNSHVHWMRLSLCALSYAGPFGT